MVSNVAESGKLYSPFMGNTIIGSGLSLGSVWGITFPKKSGISFPNFPSGISFPNIYVSSSI